MSFSTERTNSARFMDTDHRVAWQPLPRQAPSFSSVLASRLSGSAQQTTAKPPTGMPRSLASATATTRAGAAPYADLIASAAKQYGVDPALISGVIESESSFDPNAVSRAGAKGLMQLMDSTARGLGVTNAFDPTQNVMAGTKLLRQLLERYGGDVSLTLAAYNAGPGAVSQYGGIPPYGETQKYVPKVLAAMQRYAPSQIQAFRSVPQRSEQWR